MFSKSVRAFLLRIVAARTGRPELGSDFGCWPNGPCRDRGWEHRPGTAAGLGGQVGELRGPAAEFLPYAQPVPRQGRRPPAVRPPAAVEPTDPRGASPPCRTLRSPRRHCPWGCRVRRCAAGGGGQGGRQPGHRPAPPGVCRGVPCTGKPVPGLQCPSGADGQRNPSIGERNGRRDIRLHHRRRRFRRLRPGKPAVAVPGPLRAADRGRGP